VRKRRLWFVGDPKRNEQYYKPFIPHDRGKKERRGGNLQDFTSGGGLGGARAGTALRKRIVAVAEAVEDEEALLEDA